MKKWILALLAVMLLAGCGQQAAEPTEPSVKTVWLHSSITRTYADIENHTQYIYNEEDLLTDIIISDGTGAELQRYLVTCDEVGNPVRWDTSVSGLASSLTYTYDDRGRTLGTYAYTEDELVTSTENTFSGDLQICVTIKSPAQNFEQRTEHTYDDKGNLTRQDQYVNGVIASYGLFKVDKDGKPIRCENYDRDGILLSVVTYTYEGTTETRTYTDSTETLVTQTQVMNYDEWGNLLTSTILDSSGNPLSVETHTWKAIEVPSDQPRASV